MLSASEFIPPARRELLGEDRWRLPAVTPARGLTAFALELLEKQFLPPSSRRRCCHRGGSAARILCRAQPSPRSGGGGQIAGTGGCVRVLGGSFLRAEALLQSPPGCTRGRLCPCRAGGTGAALQGRRVGLQGHRVGLRPAWLPEQGSGCSQDRCGCFWGYGR